jgi:hypothetical protein
VNNEMPKAARTSGSPIQAALLNRLDFVGIIFSGTRAEVREAAMWRRILRVSVVPALLAVNDIFRPDKDIFQV